MKKICLAVVGLYINILGSFAQQKDSIAYKPKKLSLDEINFISSYYHQNGNNSAVTGGNGTEFLSDYSNAFEVKLFKYNKRNRKVTLDANLGVDYYTSASSDKIDPYTISSASSRDLRIYPSLVRTITHENQGYSLSAGGSYSHESDYRSFGINAGFIRQSKDRNRELNVRGQLYFDRVKIILPVELRTAATGGMYGEPNYHRYPWSARNTYNLSLSLSQVINKRLQMMFLADPAYQYGYLGLPFHRVYLKDFSMVNEHLPASRLKLPIGIRAHYFTGDHLVARAFYRFYTDDWGLIAHTADIELAIKPNAFFSIIPFYRYYTQSGTDYFAGYRKHDVGERYYTSNFDLSRFESHFLGGGFRFTPPKGLFGKKHWNMIELRYGYYTRSNGLHANIVSLHFKYK